MSPGFLTFEYFAGLSTTDNNLDTTLLADPRYPDRPTATYYLSAFDSRSVFPDDSHEGYGAHVTGLFIPPETGNYIFYLRSDDSSKLYLNPFGMGPAGAVLIQQETACCGAFSKLPSAPQALTAGEAYYIEAMVKEGTGGDFLQVAAKLDTDPTNPDNLLPISGAYLAILADPQGASVTITQQPVSQIVVAEPELSGQFNFAQGSSRWKVVNVNNPPGQWVYNGTRGTWATTYTGQAGGPFASMLESPQLSVTTLDAVLVTFTHRYSWEVGYDGGQVQMSVNGGPFVKVPGTSFSVNSYNGTVGGNGILNGQEGFVDQSPNYATAYLTSTASLGTFQEGDKISLRFVAMWDENTAGANPNWEIPSVDISGGIVQQSAAATLNVGAEGTVAPTIPNPVGIIHYQWQQDTGAGFVNLAGERSTTLFVPQYNLDNGIGTYRCLVSVPGAAAVSATATVTPTVPVNIKSEGGSVTISWPAPSTDFVLEQAPTVNGAWTTVPPETYQIVGNTVTATVTSPAGNVFYRLRKP